METEVINRETFSDLFTKGFVILSEKKLANLISVPENFEFLNKEERLRDNSDKDLPEDLVKRFKLAGEFLKFKYIQPLWPICFFTKFIFWDGVDRDNQYWHTDVFEDMDVFFLYYFDNTFPETGGAIHFKWGENIYSHQPKEGDLILVSNKRGFFHKADKTTARRRVASFDFKIEGSL